jgi:hypothetical protein
LAPLSDALPQRLADTWAKSRASDLELEFHALFRAVTFVADEAGAHVIYSRCLLKGWTDASGLSRADGDAGPAPEVA